MGRFPVVARYAIDPDTLLRLGSDGREVSPTHQLVAPNRIRSDALERLLEQVRAGGMTDREALAAHTRLTRSRSVCSGTGSHAPRPSSWHANMTGTTCGKPST